MVVALTTGGAGVAVVVGAAGTGKTHALAVAREVWERDGYPVIGCASRLAPPRNSRPAPGSRRAASTASSARSTATP